MAWLWIFCLVLNFSIPTLAGDVIFPRGTLTIAGKTLEIEIAETPAQQERGLMFRRSLPEGTGMLFVFPDESEHAFWMKNTFIDLAIGYFDRNRKLIDIQEMKATSVLEKNPPSYPSSGPAMYALEVPKGWFKRNRVVIGAEFTYKKLNDRKQDVGPVGPKSRRKSGP